MARLSRRKKRVAEQMSRELGLSQVVQYTKQAFPSEQVAEAGGHVEFAKVIVKDLQEGFRVSIEDMQRTVEGMEVGPDAVSREPILAALRELRNR